MAARLHLSPAHFQRIFRRWAGISPKRFVQYLTLEHAKQQLANSHSVLDTAYDAGLSGPGRLHDLFVNLEAVTPGEYKRKGAGMVIDYGFHTTPLWRVSAGDDRTRHLSADLRGWASDSVDHGHDRSAGGRARAMAMLETQWSGADLVENPSQDRALWSSRSSRVSDDGQRTVDTLVRGTNFQVKVWEALLRMPRERSAATETWLNDLEKPGAHVPWAVRWSQLGGVCDTLPPGDTSVGYRERLSMGYDPQEGHGRVGSRAAVDLRSHRRERFFNRRWTGYF